MHPCTHTYICTLYSCNMSTSDLPEMYAQSPKDCRHTFQANHKCPCYSYYVTLPKANSLNANTNTITGFFILYACLKGPLCSNRHSNIWNKNISVYSPIDPGTK